MLTLFPGGFLVHSLVTVWTVRENESLSRAVVIRVRFGSSYVGDGVRVRVLSLALTAGRAPASAVGFGSAMYGQGEAHRQ